MVQKNKIESNIKLIAKENFHFPQIPTIFTLWPPVISIYLKKAEPKIFSYHFIYHINYLIPLSLINRHSIEVKL